MDYQYQKRVMEEKGALDEKIHKLGVFLGSVVFKSLSEEEKQLLKDQYSIMAQYSSILDQRIDNF